MDEIESKALEAASAAYLNFPSHHVDGVGPVVSLNSAIEACVRAYLAASGLTSKLAALEDENKTLREDRDEFMRRLGAQWFLAQNWFPASLSEDAALSKPAAVPAEGLGGDTVNEVVAENAQFYREWLYGPGHPLAALPAEGKGEPIDQSLRDAAKAMGAYEAKNPTLVGAATPPAPLPLEGAVKVKELEWNPFRAETPFGYYHIDDQRDRSSAELKGRPPFLLTGSRVDMSRHDTLKDAKAAAQADYNRRILSSLAPAPQPVGEVRATALTLLAKLRSFSEAPSNQVSDERWHFDVIPAMRSLQTALSASPSSQAQEDGE